MKIQISAVLLLNVSLHLDTSHAFQVAPGAKSSCPSSHIERRQLITTLLPTIASLVLTPQLVFAEDAIEDPIQITATGELKKLFNEGRAFEQQGNIAAAQRLYGKVTRLAPRFIYGWASLGNTQVALGALPPAENSYTRAIDLCVESNKEEERFGVARCSDLYLLYLNRGSLRMNNGMTKEALADLELADSMRGQPDVIILQNIARARELNGQYAKADRDYTEAISMSSNEVAPFWLRSALVKFQIGDPLGALDLTRRVENKFPEAPEVRAALATLLVAKGDLDTARKKFLEIPDRARLKYSDPNYMKTVVSWPPKMLENLAKLTEAVGDNKRVSEAAATL
jgi:tetratricopeptide (TPR) repeat protein